MCSRGYTFARVILDIEKGQGSVYADLNPATADEMLIKAHLISALSAAIARNGWTRTQAALTLGVSAEALSKLTSGRISDINVHRLLQYLCKAGCNVCIHIRAASPPDRQGTIEVVTQI